MDWVTYEQEAEAFLAETELENYRAWAGLKSSLEIGAIYARHAELFDRQVVHSLIAQRDTAEARYLAAFAVDGYLQNHVSALSEEIANAELASAVEWDGGLVPFLQVPIILMNEDQILRRAELARRYYSRLAETNRVRTRRWNQLHAAARSLGFSDYVAACDDLNGLDLHRLAEQMAWVLDVTEARFESELASRLEAKRIPRDEAATWDVSAIFRAKELDRLFPADRMLPALRQTLAGLGIDLDTQANVSLDAEDRPLKSPRAFCSTIDVPKDVRLVIRPGGGVQDYRALLHEAGHTEHFAHVQPEAPFAFKWLGDSSVTETFASLLENLLLSQAWLERVLGLPAGEARETVRWLRLHSLWMVRRYAAKLNYEVELHTGLVDAKASAYAFWLKRGCRVQVPPQRFLEDVDDGFYVAQYLRAWIFEAQLREHLVRAFGEDWFARQQPGDLLKGLWSVGQQYPIEELARQIGAPGLDLKPLVRQFTV